VILGSFRTRPDCSARDSMALTDYDVERVLDDGLTVTTALL
jgi:hypothetical protein